MIRRTPQLDAFERDLIARTPVDVAQNRRIFEALYQHARLLGSLPLRDPLEGIETDIRLARILNVRSPPRPNRRGP